MPRIRRRVPQRRAETVRGSRAAIQVLLGYPPGIEWTQRDDYLDVLAEHRRATGWTPPIYTTTTEDHDAR